MDAAWYNDSSAEQALMVFDAPADTISMMDYMDALQDQDPKVYHNATRLLTALPPETIYNEYGALTLAWACANAPSSGKQRELLRIAEKLAGWDQHLLEKSILWCWEKQKSHRGKDVVLQYAVGNELQKGALNAVGLQDLVKASAKPGIEISSKRAADYSLKPQTPYDACPKGVTIESFWADESNICSPMYLDAPHGFSLAHKGRAQAVVAFGAVGQDELMIYQLQGKRSQLIDPDKHPFDKDYVIRTLPSRGLAPLDWQRLLIEITTEFAANMGFTSIGVQAGHKNFWAHHIEPNEDRPHLSPEAAAKAYDEQADRLGFTLGEDGNWHRQIVRPKQG